MCLSLFEPVLIPIFNLSSLAVGFENEEITVSRASAEFLFE
jgi:hypothetical protein